MFRGSELWLHKYAHFNEILEKDGYLLSNSSWRFDLLVNTASP